MSVHSYANIARARTFNTIDCHAFLCKFYGKMEEKKRANNVFCVCVHLNSILTNTCHKCDARTSLVYLISVWRSMIENKNDLVINHLCAVNEYLFNWKVLKLQLTCENYNNNKNRWAHSCAHKCAYAQIHLHKADTQNDQCAWVCETNYMQTEIHQILLKSVFDAAAAVQTCAH